MHKRRLDREVGVGEAGRLAVGPVHESRVDVARVDEGSEGRGRLNNRCG